MSAEAERTPTGARSGASGTGTKEQLQRAGEHLFARRGIHQVLVREINALAGQRNPSALHYHFGSRDGLVQAILRTHQEEMDAQLRPRLDELESRGAPPAAREIVQAAVEPVAAKLASPSGRDFLRILPQVLDQVSQHLRHGAPLAASSEPGRVFTLLDRAMRQLPRRVRQERLIAYSLIFASLFAERALLLESDARPALDDRQFVRHVLDVLAAVVEAPTTVR